MANYDALKASVDKNGEVMIRLDTGEKLELHKHNGEVRMNKTIKLTIASLVVALATTIGMAAPADAKVAPVSGSHRVLCC